jgi:uncharacterized protein YjbI with pentapeptide repeats
MQKTILTSLSCALLLSAVSFSASAEEDFVCPEWQSGVSIDMEALNKTQKNSMGEKPGNGLSYTKNQFFVLLGKNPVAAKDALANSKSKLAKTSEGKVDLRDLKLNGFNLSGMNFDNVDLKGAEMNGADLSGSTFRGASLSGAELEGANLNNTDLSFANVSKADLTQASLCQAAIISAEFEDAVVKGAYMRGAKLDMTRSIPKVIYLNADSVLRLGLRVPMEN